MVLLQKVQKRISFNLRVTEKTWRLVNKEANKTKQPMTHILERIVKEHYAKKPTVKKPAIKKKATKKTAIKKNK